VTPAEVQRDLAAAYDACFAKAGIMADTVIADLALFCCVNSTTAEPGPDGRIDPSQTLLAEGRRQVALRILGFLKIDHERLARALQAYARQFPQQQ
jgi:hypothetical protein